MIRLTADGLAFSYDGRAELWRDISFSVSGGQIFSVLGANGAGKSTLLRTLIGCETPKRGRVTLEKDGDIYTASQDANRFTEEIGYVPQLSETSYAFTVQEYVVMGRSPHMGVFARPKREDFERTDAALAEMGIYDIRERSFQTLSGGQQRQAVIARALVQEPSLIVMDEPTNHLDYGNQFRVLHLIEKLASRGIAVLLTTHAPEQALALGGEAGLLVGGTLHTGKTEEILTEEALREIYRVPIRLIYVKEAGRKVCIAGDP